MGKTGTYSGQVNQSQTLVKIKLPFISFKESDFFIIYCPALDISGYGLTEKEAEESFTITLNEYIKYTLNKKTFFSDLERLGWKVFKNKRKPLLPPEMTTLLNENDNFSRIFNHHSFRKFNKMVSIPA